MSIPVTCTSCGHKFKAKQKYAGRKGGCPACGATVQVPASAEAAAKPETVRSAAGSSNTSLAKTSPATKGTIATLACGDCGNTFKAQLQAKARDGKCPSCGVELTIPADPNRKRVPATAAAQVPAVVRPANDNLWDELPESLGSDDDASSGFSLTELPAASATNVPAPQLPKKKLKKRQSSISFDDPTATLKAVGLGIAALLAIGILGWGAMSGNFLGAFAAVAQLVMLGCYIMVVVSMCQHGRYGLAIFSGGGWLLGILIIFGTLGSAIMKANETNQAPEVGEMGAMIVAVGFGVLLTFFSGLTTYIVGWVKSNEWQLGGVMLAWTLCFFIGMVTRLMTAGSDVSIAEAESPEFAPPGLSVAEPEASTLATTGSNATTAQMSNPSSPPAKQSTKSGPHVKLENAVYVLEEERLTGRPAYGISVDYTFETDGVERFHEYFWVIQNSVGRTEMRLHEKGQGTLQGSLKELFFFTREGEHPTDWECWIEFESIPQHQGRARVSEVLTMRLANKMPPPKKYVPMDLPVHAPVANNNQSQHPGRTTPPSPTEPIVVSKPPEGFPRDMEFEEAYALLEESDRTRLQYGLRWFKSHPPVAEKQAEVARKLAKLTEHPDTFTPDRAAEALMVWGTDEQIPRWIALLNDESPGMRDKACEALGATNSPQAAEALARHMEKDKFDATKALKQMGPVAEPAVIVLLEHPDVFIRSAASEILGEIGGKDSMRALKKLANDPSGIPRMSAEEAYYKIEFRLKQQEQNKPSPALERVN